MRDVFSGMEIAILFLSLINLRKCLTPPVKPINQRQRQRQEQKRRGEGGEARVEGEQQPQVENDLVSDVGQQPDDDAKR